MLLTFTYTCNFKLASLLCLMFMWHHSVNLDTTPAIIAFHAQSITTDAGVSRLFLLYAKGWLCQTTDLSSCSSRLLLIPIQIEYPLPSVLWFNLPQIVFLLTTPCFTCVVSDNVSNNLISYIIISMYPDKCSLLVATLLTKNSVWVWQIHVHTCRNLH